MIDLHTHTTYSDGTTSPWQNAALAWEAGLRGFALTDHDTLAGWPEAAEAARAHGLEFVPGVELSTERDGLSVHLLGYWVDPDHEELRVECDRLRNERERRAHQILALLAKLGIDVPFEAVAEKAGTAPIGRPHIAAALVDAGYVENINAAFDTYLEDGGPAYVPKHAIDPVEGVRLLRRAGGVVVLAHPGVSEDRSGAVDVRLLDALVAEGLAGVEANHPAHEPPVAQRWRDHARERDVLVTGSSDFHGERKDARIGERTTPTTVVAQLRECAGRSVDEKRRGAPW